MKIHISSFLTLVIVCHWLWSSVCVHLFGCVSVLVCEVGENRAVCMSITPLCLFFVFWGSVVSFLTLYWNNWISQNTWVSQRSVKKKQKKKNSVICFIQYKTSIIQVKSYPCSLCISIVMNLISQPVWTSPNESVWACFPIIYLTLWQHPSGAIALFYRASQSGNHY